jgi:cytosine/adenosine deaminase-related metal-dependent hydrolase
MHRPVLIANGRVLDPERELDAPPVLDILIEDGHVRELGPAATARAATVGAEIVEAAGMMVTPGFINAHSHSHDVLLRGCFEQVPLDVWGLGAFPSGWPRRPDDEVAVRTELHATECLRGGMTTLQDMVTIVGADVEHARRIVDAYRRSGLRTVLAIQFADLAPDKSIPYLDEELGPDPARQPSQDADPRPIRDFIERLLAGPSEARLTWGIAPSAPQRCSAALLAWASALSRERGLPLLTHLYETRAQAVLARTQYAADGGSFLPVMDRTGMLAPHTVVAHGVWIAPDEIDRLGSAGVQLACNPAANLKLLNGAAPVRRYADGGVRIALGCDNSSAGDAQSMFLAMKLFASWWALQSPAGETGAAAAAFRAATTGGAAALGLAGQVGRIAPGYKADLLLFDLADTAWLPLNSAVRQLVYSESGRSLRTVMVDGEIVVDRGRLLTLDERSLVARLAVVHARTRRDLADVLARKGSLAGALLRAHERAKALPLDIDPLRLAAPS